MKSKLFSIFLACLIIFCFFIPNGQCQIFQGERKLRKIPRGDPVVDSARCGDYFIVTPDCCDDNKDRIVFFFERKLSEPDVIISVGVFLPENFIVVTDEKKPVPTIRFINDKGVAKILLKISRKDFKKSPCLRKCFDSNRM